MRSVAAATAALQCRRCSSNRSGHSDCSPSSSASSPALLRHRHARSRRRSRMAFGRCLLLHSAPPRGRHNCSSRRSTCAARTRRLRSSSVPPSRRPPSPLPPLAVSQTRRCPLSSRRRSHCLQRPSRLLPPPPRLRLRRRAPSRRRSSLCCSSIVAASAPHIPVLLRALLRLCTRAPPLQRMCTQGGRTCQTRRRTRSSVKGGRGVSEAASAAPAVGLACLACRCLVCSPSSLPHTPRCLSSTRPLPGKPGGSSGGSWRWRSCSASRSSPPSASLSPSCCWLLLLEAVATRRHCPSSLCRCPSTSHRSATPLCCLSLHPH